MSDSGIVPGRKPGNLLGLRGVPAAGSAGGAKGRGGADVQAPEKPASQGGCQCGCGCGSGGAASAAGASESPRA